MNDLYHFGAGQEIGKHPAQSRLTSLENGA